MQWGRHNAKLYRTGLRSGCSVLGVSGLHSATLMQHTLLTAPVGLEQLPAVSIACLASGHCFMVCSIPHRLLQQSSICAVVQPCHVIEQRCECCSQTCAKQYACKCYAGLNHGSRHWLPELGHGGIPMPVFRLCDCAIWLPGGQALEAKLGHKASMRICCSIKAVCTVVIEVDVTVQRALCIAPPAYT